jgi:hypothetical protein
VLNNDPPNGAHKKIQPNTVRENVLYCTVSNTNNYSAYLPTTQISVEGIVTNDRPENISIKAWNSVRH